MIFFYPENQFKLKHKSHLVTICLTYRKNNLVDTKCYLKHGERKRKKYNYNKYDMMGEEIYIDKVFNI